MIWQIALLACLALAQATYNGPVSSFEPNKEYKFKYEAQILTGVKDAGKFVSALKLDSACTLQIKSGFKAVAKLGEIQILRMVDELPEGVSPFEPLAREHLLPIQDREIVEPLMAELAKPIKFTYKQGKVLDLEVAEDEPYWSVNLKRGLLNILEIKLESTPEIDAEERLHHEIHSAYRSNEVRAEEEEQIFTVMENGIEGTCKTIYTIKHTAEGTKIVKKVKDIESCENKPFYMTGILTNLKPTTFGNEAMKPLMKVVTEAEYEVKGDAGAFLITKAIYKAQHMVAPLQIKKGVIASFTTQKIELIDVSDRLTIDAPSRTVAKEALKFELPQSIMTADPYSQYSSSMDIREMKSTVEDILRTIVTETRPEVSVEAVYKMIELLRLMKEMPKATLKELINEVEPMKKEILIDLIPAIDTPTAIKIIKELLMEQTITEFKAIAMITANVLVAPPSPEIIDALVPLCKTEYTCSRPLKTTVLLSIGTIAGKIYKMREILPVELVEPTLENVVTELKTLLTATTETHEKIVIITAMGNAALPAFLPELEKAIVKSTESTLVKEAAIYYLANYTVIAPAKVQKILVPVYLDVTKPAELRIAAIVTLIETKPSLPLLTIITTSLLNEPSIEVGGFTFTYLSSVAKTTTRMETAKKVKLALLLAKPVIPKFMGSTAIAFEAIEEKSKIGSLIELFATKLGNTILPSTVGLKANLIWDDVIVPLTEATISFKDMQMVEDILIGEEGLVWQVIKNQIPPSAAIDRLVRIVKDGEFVTASEQTKKISMCIKLFATEVLHLDITHADVATIVKSIEMKLPTLLPKLISGLHLDVIKPLMALQTAYMVPTPVGLPVSLNTTVMTLAGVYGDISVTGLTSMAGKIKITKDIKTSSATVMMLDLGVHLPMLVSGHAIVAKVQTKLPIEAVTEIDMKKMTIKSLIATPKTELETLKVDITPVAFVMKTPVLSKQDMIVIDDIVKPEIAIPEIISTEEPELFGLGVKVVLTKMTPVMTDVELFPLFMGKHSLKVVIKPGLTRPQQIEFKMAVLCPTCPMTEAGKHEFIFDTEAVEEVAGSSWSWWNSAPSPRRIAGDVSFDTVVPDTQFVDPTMKYTIAAILKTKEATAEKIIAAQVCALTHPTLTKVQIDTQVIAPSFVSGSLIKAKVVTKALLPEYLYEPSVVLRESDKVVVHKTEVFFGGVANVQKKLAIETNLMCIECNNVAGLPKEMTPINLETKVTEIVEIPQMIKEIIKKVIVLVKTVDKKIVNSFIDVEDILTFALIEETPELIIIDAAIIPAELKAILKLKIDTELLKVKVCPFELPWAAPVTPITYNTLPEAGEDFEEIEGDAPCSRKLLTKKIRRTNDLGEAEVCFSIEPIHVCRGACRRPEEYSQEQIQLVCKPRFTPETRRLLSESLIRPLYDLPYQRNHLIQHQVAVPNYCDAL